MWSQTCLAQGRRRKHVVTPVIPGLVRIGWPSSEEGNMKSVGIREAKARLSALARAAANGEPTLLTDHGEPRAVITSLERGAAAQAAGISDLSEFRRFLLAIPHLLELDF
jgi:prevent-host-death family protein